MTRVHVEKVGKGEVVNIDVNLNNLDDINSYWDDWENVNGDPDRYCLAIVIAFFHTSDITIDEVYKKQKMFHMKLPKDQIRKFIHEWITKEYLTEPRREHFKATDKLYKALSKTGVKEIF